MLGSFFPIPSQSRWLSLTITREIVLTVPVTSFKRRQAPSYSTIGSLLYDWQVRTQVPRWQPHSIWPFHFKWKTLKSLPCSDICIFMSSPHCANISVICWPKSPNSETSCYLLHWQSLDPQLFWPPPALRELSEGSTSSRIGKSDPLYAKRNSESNSDLKFNLYARVALYLNTAVWRHGLILLSHDTDACRIWP